jgi:RNA polymerase sigma-70 factor (ECF subfamily)
LAGLGAEIRVLKTSEEDDAIEGCRRGDPDAQRRLFDDYQHRIFSIALYLSSNAADAAEITQDVFLKVFASLPQFRGEAKFETWLYSIVANTARDHGRRLRSFLFRDSAFWRSRPDRVPSVEEQHDQHQVDEAVRSAVASLPEKLRLPVVLRYVEDLSYGEIGEVMNLPPGTVAARLSRAHALLARKLERVRR